MLEILDIRQVFLDHTFARARRHELANIVPMLADGGSLPYPDGCFDAALLITVLGELPDLGAALGELHRVFQPAGRLVVGEIFIDPDFPRFGWLVKRARAAELLLRAAQRQFARLLRPGSGLRSSAHGFP